MNDGHGGKVRGGGGDGQQAGDYWDMGVEGAWR